MASAPSAFHQQTEALTEMTEMWGMMASWSCVTAAVQEAVSQWMEGAEEPCGEPFEQSDQQ